MKRLFIAVFLSIFFLSGTVYANSIIFHWDVNDHYYQRIDQKMYWTDAKAYAEGLGGYLVTLTSVEENNFVYDNLNDGTYYWIGATALNGLPTSNPDGWEWITGEAWSYHNWSGGEPNGSGIYAQFYPLNSGQWDDTNNTHNANGGNEFFVEWNPVPEPATMLLLGSGLVGLAGFRRKFRKN